MFIILGVAEQLAPGTIKNMEELKKEINHYNRLIDNRIIAGKDYKELARMHRQLVWELEQLSHRKLKVQS